MKNQRTILPITETNYAYAKAMYQFNKDPKYKHLADQLEMALLEAGYDDIDMDILDDRIKAVLNLIKKRNYDN